MLPVIVIRPEPGASATCAKARALGLDAVSAPLFAVRPLAWQPLPREEVDAILLGSANALRHAGPALECYRCCPTYAVGLTTAQAAIAAGLDVVATGSGGLQSVMPLLDPAHRRLLRLSGRERVELEPPPGVMVALREVYASEPLPLPQPLRDRLAAPALVLLHSGEAAAHFAQSLDAAGIGRGIHRIAALAPRVAERAGSGWAALEVAERPDDAALLALAVQMCQRFSLG
ncbi:uroporphyrinogen-III synthase [Novosphingobium colocasiae]|uniref:Uroporphyrinogen III methyltransferase n=1 Tax=Novosphingobium colocasiae TaxID=1256513 RepID=A0A918P9C6_9SPHN|nr:uroporphyrinogen-III synthase [Novosphingobium colocasiae]GGY93643.1 uroporphyrinogen III methyltransferase [Novosphingobium colocasiae]